MSEFFIRLPHSWCGASVASVIEVAEAAEELGFDGVSVQDHILAGPGVAPCGHTHRGDDRTVLESLATLAFVAARTTRVKLLTGVLVVPFRHVVWIAKTGAAIDQLSSGRLVLGLGIGAPTNRTSDHDQNIGPHSAISDRETGLFDLPGPRGKIMDEALQALDALWTQDPATFSGDYIDFAGIDLMPQPVQRPRPPMYVGGRAEGAIRRAALYADGWFPSQASTEALGAGLATARALAAEAGRPEPRGGLNLFLSIDPDGDAARAVVADGLGHRFKSAQALAGATMSGTPDDILARIRAYEAVGCTLFDLKVLPHTGAATLAQMQLLADEVMPAARAGIPADS